METHYKGDIIFVEELFVSMEHQRKGHGAALMGKIEEYAKENSFVSVSLLTSKGSPPFKFYEKSGYTHLDFLAYMHKRIE